MVARDSNLARQDVYKVLAELQTLGLIEKHINTPTKFAAFPIQDVTSILLNRRAEKTSELHTKTTVLINNFKADAPKTIQGEEPKLFLIPEGEAFVLRLRQAVETAQERIDIVSSIKNLPQGMFFLAELLQNAMERGVKIRCITDTLENLDSQLKMFRGLTENPSFEVRTILNQQRIRFGIYDKKELTVVLISEKDFAKSSLLWSDCVSIVEAYQDYFEMKWHKSQKSSRNNL
jgi:sugar-specific transcriptional regulator TrmB